MGCRARAEAESMVRIARQPDGSLCIDRVAPGRGAWLCRDASSDSPQQSCLVRALRSGAFPRAFKAQVGELHDADRLRDTSGEHERMGGAGNGPVEETKGNN
ncbi:MAG: YlxR family protein [Acidimicrobiales bacterium]